MVNHGNSPSKVYLTRINEAIEKLYKYIANVSYDDFESNEILKDACLMQLQHIGETIIQLLKINPSIVFTDQEKIQGMRNFISHEYQHIRSRVAWLAIKEKLPILEKEIKEYLNKD